MAPVWVKAEPSLALSIKTTWKGERKHYGEIDRIRLTVFLRFCGNVYYVSMTRVCIFVVSGVEQTSLIVYFCAG